MLPLPLPTLFPMAEVDLFVFEEWARASGLTETTQDILKTQEVNTRQTLGLLLAVDIKSLGLTLGQQKLLQTAVTKILQPPGDDTLPVEQAQQQADPPHPATPAITIRDVRHQAETLAAAGKTFDQVMGSTPASPPATQSLAATFDPRVLLTVKASSSKTVHITQFLTEKTNKKRNSRKKELVLMFQ